VPKETHNVLVCAGLLLRFPHGHLYHLGICSTCVSGKLGGKIAILSIYGVLYIWSDQRMSKSFYCMHFYSVMSHGTDSCVINFNCIIRSF